MVEASQFLFDRVDVLKTLIKAQGIKSGHWILSIEFNFGASNVGPTPETALPSAIVGVGKIGIQRVDPSDPTAIDASGVM